MKRSRCSGDQITAALWQNSRACVQASACLRAKAICPSAGHILEQQTSLLEAGIHPKTCRADGPESGKPVKEAGLRFIDDPDAQAAQEVHPAGDGLLVRRFGIDTVV